MLMKIEIIKFKCDVCGKEFDEPTFTNIPYPIVYIPTSIDHETGEKHKPYIGVHKLDFCKECADKVLRLQTINNYGTTSEPLTIREAENDEKAN